MPAVCFIQIKAANTLHYITKIIEKQQRTSRLASSYIASVPKTPAGGDAHSVCQGTFNGASAFLWHCNTNCKLHSDEGRGGLPFLLSRAVCVRSPWLQCYCNALQRVRFLPSFAVIVCAWVRLCALARCLRLFICRLRGFLLLLQYFARLARFRAFMWLVLQPRLLQPLLCALRSEIQRPGGAKDGGTAGGQAPPASVGAFYSLRSPSASRCSFSAIK